MLTAIVSAWTSRSGSRALLGWAVAGVAVAALTGWSVWAAERESRHHTVLQAAW